MQLDFGQLFDNLLAMLTLSFLLELALSALFTIQFFNNLFNEKLRTNLRNALILAASLVLVLYVDNLSIFYKIKIKINSILEIALTTLLIARLTHLFRDTFQYIKDKAGQENYS